MEYETCNGSLLGSLRRVSDSAMSILKNRAELAVLELKEEKSRLVGAAVWVGVFIVSSMMAIIAIALTLLYYFWDEKLNVAIGLLAFCVVGALTAFFVLKRRLKTPKPFAETIAQFKKDRAWLQS